MVRDCAMWRCQGVKRPGNLRLCHRLYHAAAAKRRVGRIDRLVEPRRFTPACPTAAKVPGRSQEAMRPDQLACGHDCAPAENFSNWMMGIITVAGTSVSSLTAD